MTISSATKQRQQIREVKAIDALKRHNAKKTSFNDIHQQKLWDVRVELIKSFKDKFVRDFDAFQPKKSSNMDTLTIQLVKHCFGKFSFPKFLERAWVEIQNVYQNRNHPQQPYSIFEQRLSVCIATGGSAHKEYFKNLGFTKKQTHNFLTCNNPQIENIIQAMIFGVAFTENNDKGIAFRICKSETLNSKISELFLRHIDRLETSKFEFWIKCIQWFAVNAPESHQKLDEVIDYIADQYRQNSNFEIHGKGYTFESIYRKTIEWHWALRRLKKIGNQSWEGMPYTSMNFKTWDDSNKRHEYWSIDQITDAQTLQKEGTSQRHCVYSYRDKCIEGRCSIWSLRHSFFEDDEWKSMTSKVTIEVSSYGSVVQSRGVANRAPTAVESRMISAWKVSNGIC